MAERIIVITPRCDGAEADAYRVQREYWRQVDEDPAMVVCAELHTAGERQAVAVWSTFPMALTWARDEAGDGAVLYAKRIDEPDWGGGGVTH